MNNKILILIFIKIIIFTSCKQEDCAKVDKSKLNESELSTFRKVCSDKEGKNESRAIGFYNSNIGDGGRLENAEDLLRRNSNIHKLFLQRDRSYGTDELIEIITRLANQLERRFINTEKLQIGDLSNINGGLAAPNHKSHQNGLDVDIVYLSKDKKLQGQSNSYWTQYFVKNNTLSSNFDTPRNWEMFKLLIKTKKVSRIFVDRAIKSELCSYAKLKGEYKKYEEVLRRLSASKYHETHFHLRLKCPEGDRECIDMQDPPRGTGCGLEAVFFELHRC